MENKARLWRGSEREILLLRDGRRRVVRPIRPSDAEGLIELHDRLSLATRYRRYFSAKRSLYPAEARYLADVDFARSAAFVATVSEDGAERIVGDARLYVDPTAAAELALLVRDDHQRRGLGSVLAARLVAAAACGSGVRTLRGEALPDNRPVLELFRKLGAGSLGRGEGVTELRAPLCEAVRAFGLGPQEVCCPEGPAGLLSAGRPRTSRARHRVG